MALPPSDRELPALHKLFDGRWVWQRFCDTFGAPDDPPRRIRPRQFLYRPRKRAVLGYVAERRYGDWVVEDPFAIQLTRDEPEVVFRYPDDPYLPGLSRVASAAEAQDLIPEYVGLHPYRLHVEAVRYRPATRAVLTHTVTFRRRQTGEVVLYVRVMPPDRLKRVLRAAELVELSGFLVPPIVGRWEEGGAMWLSRVPGETLRALIRAGTPPEPEPVLAALNQLWSAPLPPAPGRPLDLAAAFRSTSRLLSQVLREDEACRELRRARHALKQFVEAWRPSALAHNDFYDDQALLTPSGRLALVDFEEIGPGDPLLDIGNLLAHLRWMVRFGIAGEDVEHYRRRFRAAALERFGWGGRDLALREAFALFRLSSNPVRHLQQDWPRAVESGLKLVAEALDESP